MSVLLAAAIAALASAAFGYIFNGLSRHREAAADALVAALRDAQRSQFMLDLENEDHAALIGRPLHRWSAFVGRFVDDATVVDQMVLDKAAELLEWRMNERESRLRFVVTASGTSIRKLAQYHCSHTLHLVSAGSKNLELVDRHFDDATDDLIRAIRSIRVPAAVRPVYRLLRHLPLVSDRLVSDQDIRMLIADYSERRPPTYLSSGLSRLIGLGG